MTKTRPGDFQEGLEFHRPPRGVKGVRSVVEKVTWQKAGRVTEPGRYMFRFGWLTVAAEDLEIWRQFPDAAFTLVGMPSETDAPEEFHLGAFELPLNNPPGGT